MENCRLFLWRCGVEESSNSFYFARISPGRPIGNDVSFIREYSGLAMDMAHKIVCEVNRFSGDQPDLLRVIDNILLEGKK